MILGRESYNQFGKLLTYEDVMLMNKIDRTTSFSKDTDLDTRKYGAIMLHNEAVAMPFNYRGTKMMLNPQNGNPRTITRYQYGIG
ncbi:MAG: hypothetical protein ACRCYA_04085 [Cetobacterium sp.]|uniref:hypothetical protein n=1 Tax=Cetobacterium sp. TaxID=2071632 RepID=UPI003F394018